MELDLFFLLHFHAWTVETNAWMDLGIQVSLPDNGFLWICTQKWDWYGSSLVLLPWNQRSNCQHPLDHWKSKRVPVKHLLLFYWLCQSVWLCGSQQTVENSSRWEKQTTLPASWETCMQVKKKQLELDVAQQIGSKSAKEFVMAAYCHPAYLIYMQSTSCEMLGWMKHKLESRLPGEISINSDTQMTPFLWQKVKKN